MCVWTQCKVVHTNRAVQKKKKKNYTISLAMFYFTMTAERELTSPVDQIKHTVM